MKMMPVPFQIEPFKPEPDPARRRLDGCTAISPSPPAPSPLPKPPPPGLPPLPPFVPLRSNEQIVFSPMVVLSLEFTLDGDVNTIDRAAIQTQLESETACYAPCVLRLTFRPGSVVVIAEAATPVAEADRANAVSTYFQQLVTADQVALGDRLGVKVLSVSPRVTAAARTVPIVTTLSPPVAPPPGAPEEGQSIVIFIAIAAGGVLVLLLIAAAIWCIRSRGAQQKPAGKDQVELNHVKTGQTV